MLDAVKVRKADVGVVEIEWASNPVSDIVADSVLSVILQTLSSPGTSKAMAKAEGGAAELGGIIRVMLEDRYGAANVSAREDGALALSVDGHAVEMSAGGETVTCGNPETQKKVEAVVKRILARLNPSAACACSPAQG